MDRFVRSGAVRRIRVPPRVVHRALFDTPRGSEIHHDVTCRMTNLEGHCASGVCTMGDIPFLPDSIQSPPLCPVGLLAGSCRMISYVLLRVNCELRRMACDGCLFFVVSASSSSSGSSSSSSSLREKDWLRAPALALAPPAARTRVSRPEAGERTKRAARVRAESGCAIARRSSQLRA